LRQKKRYYGRKTGGAGMGMRQFREVRKIR